MSVAPNSGIIDFSTFFPPSGGQDGIQGQVPAPLAGQGNYVLTGNGWASLGSLGILSYQGTWDAATNTPTIVSGVGTQGQYYVVSVAGNTNIDGISNWGVGDWIIFNGATWQKIEGGSQGNFTTLDVTGQTTLGDGSANYLEINGANTGSSPTIEATGSDTNVGLNLTTKGAGTVNIAAINATGGTIDNTAIGNTTPAAGNFTATRINQPWDEGTGRLQVNGQAAIEGNAVAQDVVVQGGNNLLLRSQEFNDAVWTNTGLLAFGSGSIANAAVAPDGTTTADLITQNSSNSAHGNQQNRTVPAGSLVTASQYLKKPTSNAARYVGLNITDAVAKNYAILIDLDTGTFVNWTGFFGYNAPVSASVTSVGSGWFRATVTAQLDSNRTTAGPGVFFASGSNPATNNIFTGNGTDGVLVWGAQLEIGTVASPYTPTTSAAVTTTNDVFVPSGQVLTGNGTASLPSYSALGDTNTGMFFPAADTIAFAEGGAEAMRIDSSGNVGIGTSSIPNYSNLVTLALSDTNGATIELQKGSTTQGAIYNVGDQFYIQSNGTVPIVFATNTTERYRITSTGQLAASLDGTASAPVLSRSNDLNTGLFFPAADTLAISTNGSEMVRVDSSGNVGIGTSNPERRLSIQGTSSVGNNRLVITQIGRATSGTPAAGIGGWLQLLAQDDAGTQREAAIIGWDLSSVSAASPQGRLYLGTRGANDALVINNSGNVGIATNAPTALLDVNSDTIRLRTARTPATAGAAGNQGDICWDADYIYICTATDTWKRVAIATWP